MLDTVHGPSSPKITLTDEELRDIERAASDIPIHGARYPEAMERLSNR